jgi:hypothetical protein
MYFAGLPGNRKICAGLRLKSGSINTSTTRSVNTVSLILDLVFRGLDSAFFNFVEKGLLVRNEKRVSNCVSLNTFFIHN